MYVACSPGVPIGREELSTTVKSMDWLDRGSEVFSDITSSNSTVLCKENLMDLA